MNREFEHGKHTTFLTSEVGSRLQNNKIYLSAQVLVKRVKVHHSAVYLALLVLLARALHVTLFGPTSSQAD
jgi:hypothetical protein